MIYLFCSPCHCLFLRLLFNLIHWILIQLPKLFRHGFCQILWIKFISRCSILKRLKLLKSLPSLLNPISFCGLARNMCQFIEINTVPASNRVASVAAPLVAIRAGQIRFARAAELTEDADVAGELRGDQNGANDDRNDQEYVYFPLRRWHPTTALLAPTILLVNCLGHGSTATAYLATTHVWWCGWFVILSSPAEPETTSSNL